jgi:hypothetical protein
LFSATESRVSRTFLLRAVWRRCEATQLTSGARARIKPVFEFLERGSEKIYPLALAIRAVGSPDVRSLVPIETQPSEVVKNSFLGSFNYPGLIEVFDAKNECPS